MLGIISGLKRSTVGGIGKIYLGLLGSNLYSYLIYDITPNTNNATIQKKPKNNTMYRPPKVRPKNLTIGGRYFYG